MNDVLRFSAFQLREKCGEGDGGVVWKAVRRADTLWCAVKILRAPLKELADKEGVPKEAAILSTLNEAGHHPNLVKYHGWGRVYRVEMIAAGYEKMCCFMGDVGAFIVMEWVEGEILENKILQSSFGRNKRREICKQMLDAVNYMNMRGISHGSLFLNNLIISKSINPTSTLPRLVICDFGSASYLSGLSEAQKEVKSDKDRCQCGGVLLALFSSANLNNQINTNRIMARDALKLVKDLVDVRKLLTLEDAMQTPFLTADTPEDKFFVAGTPLWNDEVVENISNHIISTGNLKDFASASLVCKHFFVILQRRFLCTPHSQAFMYNARVWVGCYGKVEECCMWLESVPYEQSWANLHDFSDGDKAFEVELLDAYFEGVIPHFFTLQDLVAGLSTNQPWNEIILHFHDICGQSSYVGQLRTRELAGFARERARGMKASTFVFDIQDEIKLYLRILAKMRECVVRFNREAKEYARQHNLFVQISADTLL